MGIRFVAVVAISLIVAACAWAQNTSTKSASGEGGTYFDGIDIHTLSVRVANLEAALRVISPTALPMMKAPAR